MEDHNVDVQSTMACTRDMWIGRVAQVRHLSQRL
jgi:hypothetical protein